MDIVNSHPKQLMMLRCATPIPDIPLPEGWSVRQMREGEHKSWVSIAESAGFFNSVEMDSEARWMKAMGSDPRVRMENIFFTCESSGKPVATATALLYTDEQRSQHPNTKNGPGCLHNVAALSEYRGKGAGSAVTAAVLRRFAEIGFGDCVLKTDDHRLPAIKSYIRLGWLPVMYAPDMRMRWVNILSHLGYKSELGAVDENWEATESLLVK